MGDIDENMIKVTFLHGEKLTYPKNTSLLEISKKCKGKFNSPIVGARINNNIKELNCRLNENAEVEFIDLTDSDGILLYQRSLTFVLIRAAKELFSGCKVTIEHSLSKGLYGEIHWLRPINHHDIQAIKKRMKDIIEADIPFERKALKREEAIALFEREEQYDKVRLFQYRQKATVHIYSCGWLNDYFYGHMVPSTGYLKKFDVRFYLPGFILYTPSKEQPDKTPSFVEQPKLFRIFRESEKWGEILEINDIASINEAVASGDMPDLIRVAEGLQEKKIAHIADQIADNIDRIRLALIAGPSSSGKTTFTQRLSIQLRVNGIKPIAISLDDYFLDRQFTPRDENGNLDFEALEAVDIDLFNEHLMHLIQGQEIEVPHFNFLKGKREYIGKKIGMRENQLLLIEGIHGLNGRLTEAIPKIQKYKVYVSALTQLNIDNHNRIPTTDNRLLRRIVRDNLYRNHDALSTIRLWPSVRRGEQKNIFPFQEEADIMFNSASSYELSVLKMYAEPLLQKILNTEREYSEAKRLLKLLGYCLPFPSDDVPANSILREFIGNSCFRK